MNFTKDLASFFVLIGMVTLCAIYRDWLSATLIILGFFFGYALARRKRS
jgi:hypothetical protein